MADLQRTDGGTGCVESPLGKETRFGAYSVVLRSANDLNEPIRAGLGLTEEDQYLEVHVPDSVTGTPRTVLGAFKEGVVDLADFLLKERLSPKCLLGVTHENVARPAQRFLNFQVLSGVPEEAVGREKATRVDEGYGKTKRAGDGIPRGPLCLCYQSYEAFMAFTERLRVKRGGHPAAAGG
ncbi:MAG TPA: hypothetical protein VLS25_07715 [Dehalococcoidia bacterium]|nr:hypothetical protein [Dehalococcoidia bacterium]